MLMSAPTLVYTTVAAMQSVQTLLVASSAAVWTGLLEMEPSALVRGCSSSDQCNESTYIFLSDIDECSSSPCSADAQCDNTLGGYNCTCNSGFSGNGSNCEGI